MKIKLILATFVLLIIQSISLAQMNDPLGELISNRDRQVRAQLGLGAGEEIVYDTNQDEDADNPATSQFSLKTLLNNNSESLGSGRFLEMNTSNTNCTGSRCALYIRVYKGYQDVEIYENGQLTNRWKVSSGWAPTYETPNFSGKPERVYWSYMSKKYPGKGYIKNGRNLGNMPYAVFYNGGFALHGTTSIQRLGQKASHGCIRLHPDHAEELNTLVRQYGPKNTWIYINN